MRRCIGFFLIAACLLLPSLLRASTVPQDNTALINSPVTIACGVPGKDGISISLTVEEFDIQKNDALGEDLIMIEGEPGMEIKDRPVLPFIASAFLVPPVGEVTLSIDDVLSDTRRDLSPVQARITDNLDQYGSEQYRNPIVKARETTVGADGFWPASPVEIGSVAILRGYRLVNLRIYPVQYNAATGETRFNRQVDFHLEIPGADQQVWDAPERLRSIHAWRVVRNLVENPPRQPYRDDMLHANYLFIVPEAEQVDATIAPLIEWRVRQGHNVSVAHVPNNQNRAEVLTAIQAAYEGDNPVEYVAIIGDASDSPFVVQASNQTGDYEYSTLDGNDPLPDVAIGRISADTIEMLGEIVAKILSYETTPYMEHTEWFKQGSVVAGHIGNGLGEVLCAKYVRKELLAMGFTEVRHWYHTEDGEIPVGRAQPFLTNSFEWGISVLHYRAYQAMNWLPLNEIYNLNNRRGQWPAVLAISCDTGDFVATDGYTEAFLRARGGGIGAIGTATPGTAPQYNNIVSGGVWKGIYKNKLFNMGWGLVTGKVELWRAYDGFDGNYMNFMAWNNLMGDPGTVIWTDVPRALTVEHPQNLPLGGSFVLSRVTDAESGDPEAGALVCLSKGDEVHLTRYTDESGTAAFAVDPEALSEGAMHITVTKHNALPYLGDIAVEPAQAFFGVIEAVVSDDQGNNDGILNPSEEVELSLSIANQGVGGGNQPLTVTAESLNPLVEVSAQPAQINNAPAPDESANATFEANVDPSCPDQTEVQIQVRVVNRDNVEWISLTSLTVNSPELAVPSLPLNRAQLAPGGSYNNFNIEFLNQGHAALGAFQVRVVEPRNFLEFRDNEANYNGMDVGGRQTSRDGGFSFGISPLIMPGTPLDLLFYIESDAGFRDTVSAVMTVGVNAVGGPIGPDEYGYYCFDSGDVDYNMAPRFEWIEINPAVEGFHHQGVRLDINDPGDNLDESIVIDLPFPFQYYGQTFERLTVCTNGWAAFGDQAELADFRNNRIGQALGPNVQMAVWWDNLMTVQTSAILTFHNEEAGKFIIEWSGMRRLIQGGQGALETFELILIDPTIVPTATGDGVMTFQYLEVTNENRQARNDTPFCTIGISNLDDSDGLQYTYWNQFPTGARPIESRMALTFSTATSYVTGAARGRVLDHATGNPIPNAVVSSRGVQSLTDGEGRYLLNLLIGDDYNITARAAGWNDSTRTGFEIAEEETLDVDFRLLFSSFALSTDYVTDEMGTNAIHRHNLTIHNSGNGSLTWSASETYSEGESGLGNRVVTRILAGALGDLSLEGVVWADGFYFVTGQAGQMENLIYVLDENFQEVNRFPQVGNSREGMKDITYGNGLLWGSGERNIHAFTTDGELVRTIEGPYSNNQALAFDTERQMLWVWAANGAIRGIDLDGNQVTQFPAPRVNITGLAYWAEDPDGYELYMVEDPRNDQQNVYRMNLTNGEVDDVGSLNTGEVGQSGGAFIAAGYGQWGTSLMIMVNDYYNQRGDRLDVWQMGSYRGWLTLSAREGIVGPEADQALELALSSMGLFPAVYRAEVTFAHSGQGADITLPVDLTVNDQAVPGDLTAPERFDFEAAYPNPFNAALNLSYSLSHPSDVRLNIYSLDGRASRDIVCERQNAGRYQVIFDAAELPSGVYLARLTAGAETRLIKLVCVK